MCRSTLIKPSPRTVLPIQVNHFLFAFCSYKNTYFTVLLIRYKEFWDRNMSIHSRDYPEIQVSTFMLTSMAGDNEVNAGILHT